MLEEFNSGMGILLEASASLFASRSKSGATRAATVGSEWGHARNANPGSINVSARQMLEVIFVIYYC